MIVSDGSATSALLKITVAFCTVDEVPIITVAVAISPSKVTFVPDPETNSYVPCEKSSCSSVTVCEPSGTTANRVCPLASVFCIVVASSMNWYSSRTAVDSNVPSPSRSMFLITVISGKTRICPPGTGTFFAPEDLTSPVSPPMRLCCDEPLQAPMLVSRVRK